jgi:3-hydroxyisobutyrate dehydrogenase-like beta-hydroxyacid dehydrogenase
MSHVAFIGLRRMGHGMAGRYLDGGFSVAVWNRSGVKADDLIARGARWADALQLDLAVGRATLAVYQQATAYCPNDDEGRLIDVVGRTSPM